MLMQHADDCLTHISYISRAIWYVFAAQRITAVLLTVFTYSTQITGKIRILMGFHAILALRTEELAYE